MGSLTKIIINSVESVGLAVWQIQNWVIKHNYQGLVILDSNGQIHLSNSKFIPQIFNSYQVFISSDSFQQNNINICGKIRSWVSHQLKLLNLTELLCVGGESYLYGLTLGINNIYHLTNSPSIYEDCEFNKKFFSSSVSNGLVDYNSVKKINCDYKVGLVNLANLNHNLVKKINQSRLQTIIIISCHHDDFWKKMKLLNGFVIKSREYFVCDKLKYFVTVNVLHRKNCLI